MSSKELTNAELTKKLKSTRRRLKDAEAQIVELTAANVALGENVTRFRSTQEKLMHNLRRVMAKLSMSPKAP